MEKLPEFIGEDGGAHFLKLLDDSMEVELMGDLEGVGDMEGMGRKS